MAAALVLVINVLRFIGTEIVKRHSKHGASYSCCWDKAFARPLVAEVCGEA
jgi:hypothetical protein